MNIQINNSSDDPIYLQIKNQIKAQSISGELKVGEQLPSIRFLAKELRVSMLTAKRAFDELELDGFINSVQGKGNFVAAQNKELIREEYLKKIESKLQEVVELSEIADVSSDELIERVMWRVNMSKYAIEIKDLVKTFDSFKLGPVNLTIPKGTIVGYIGQNGAGKSTTIKLLLGLLRKDSGDIRLLDEENPNSVELKDKLGVVFDDLLVPEEMTLIDVEKFCYRVYSKWDKKQFYGFVEKFNLPHKKMIKNYSRGMKMKLSMAVALSHNAELLILDEATSGLDPIVREEILDLLLDFMQDENHTILISSHILSDLEKVADYIAFIHNGKILFMETKDELKENYGICTLSNEEVNNFDEEAIVGRRIHSFGQELLVKKSLVPDGIKLQKPSIEDIMIYFVKGVRQ